MITTEIEPGTGLRRLPDQSILTALQTRIAGARVNRRTKAEEAARVNAERANAPPPPSAEDIKRQKKEPLLAELNDFLSITGRPDDEIRAETMRLKKAFDDAGFSHALDGNLEGYLEKIDEITKDKKLRTMIFKMLLVLGEGHSGHLSVRLDPKHKDHDFGKQFFTSLSNDEIREYIRHIYLPDKDDVDALLALPDRQFVIDAISKEGTKKRNLDAQDLLLLTIQRLAPNFDFNTVACLFEVGVNHNGDHLRQSVAELMKTKYPTQAVDYFKQVAENRKLNIEDFGLRAAGIKNYALMRKEQSVPVLRDTVLAEQNIDLVDVTLPLLLNENICGTGGKEIVLNMIEQRLAKKDEPALEVYWIVRDGHVSTDRITALLTKPEQSDYPKQLDCYDDLVEMMFSRIKGLEEHVKNLDNGKVNLGITSVFYSLHRGGTTTECLISRVGIKKLEAWALRGSTQVQMENAFSFLACCDPEQLDREAPELVKFIGLNAA